MIRRLGGFAGSEDGPFPHEAKDMNSIRQYMIEARMYPLFIVMTGNLSYTFENTKIL